MADLTAEELAAMVREGESENRSLEFKEHLPGLEPKEKLEFLIDIAAMANAGGGRLLYGVVDKRDEHGSSTGVADAAPGVHEQNVGKAVLRLEQILHGAGIQPRVPGCRFYLVAGAGPDPVVVLEVPRSWLAPHMVCLDDRQLFYSRHGSGNFRLDVKQIREAFLASEGVETRMRRFRDERLAKIVAHETPVPLMPGVRFVMHLLPIAAFSGTTQLDPRAIVKQMHSFAPNSSYVRYNIDGTVHYPGTHGDSNRSYVQVFRNGAVESVLGDVGREEVDFWFIPIRNVEEELVRLLSGQLQALDALGVPAPLSLTGAILNAKGFIIPVTPGPFSDWERRKIDRDVVLLPDIMLEDLTGKAEETLRPLFEATYQAGGYLRP
jgi:hypothetical protein